MWIYKDREITEIEANMVGFVYCITNLKTSRQYIGKKIFQNKKTKVVKGKRKKILTESDWYSYYGSNAELIADVEQQGAGSFKREILHFCMSRTELSYMEAREQFMRDVLRHPDKFYNAWTSCKINRKQLSARFAPKE